MLPRRRLSRPVLASALAYAGITIVMGRHVLASLGSRIASDIGDPLFGTALLKWNATHLPWTHAWYQFPIFYPIADALALAEHLLGVSVIATPIQWLVGSPLVTYNIVVLLSFPLCGLAMYALIWKLTRNRAAAFLAGLAYAFAPYRVGQLPHIQVLAAWGMPVALLGLHAYLETRRRRWLVLFGASWLLQAGANGYYLVFFTGVVVLWVAWFMAARGRWRDVGRVVATMAVAAIPLVPILYQYVTVQRAFGMSRGIGEMAVFSADIAAVLCAPSTLTFWGWIQIGCGPEGQLFAGVTFTILCVAGALALRKSRAGGADGTALNPSPSSRVREVLLRLTVAIAVLYGAITVWTLIFGPWKVEVPFRASASSADKPASVTLFFAFASLLLSRGFHNVIRRGSTETFYVLCAAVCWLLAWGPFPRLLGETVLYQAPYAWIAHLPGGGSLRAPARLWMMCVLCLVVFMALGMARVLSSRTRRSTILTIVAACGLVADGFSTINAAELPATPLVPPSGKTVMVLPIGQVLTDITAVYDAVIRDYRVINGYSGYEPPYYEALRTLSDARDPQLFAPFLDRDELHVLVNRDAVELRTLVAGQAGAELVLEGPVAHYRLPRHAAPSVRTEPAGTRIPVQAVEATCSPEGAGVVIDGDLRTRWVCGVQSPDQMLLADLGSAATVGTIVHALGSAGSDFPRHLVVETSEDGSSWVPAWEGSPAVAVLHAATAKPLETRAVIEFTPRTARYVRLRQLAREGTYAWSLAELEVWSGESK